MIKKVWLSLLAFSFVFVFSPGTSLAVSGENIGSTRVKVYTKQGDDWFKARTIRTTPNGTLVAQNVLPGEYKMTINDSDKHEGQTLGVRLKMLDSKGRKIKQKTDVDLSIFIDGDETAIGTVKTDKSGWLEVEGLALDTVYELSISDNSSISKKENTYRIKTQVKIDESHWFSGSYKRTDENKVLEAKNVLPGKYKFKYRLGDADAKQPFTLHAQMLDKKGKKITEPVQVKISGYINDVLTPLGTLMTDDRGWITLPGVMTMMTYKVEVN